MQNQRQNGRPDAAVRMAGLFLVLFCVAAVLIPAKTLFTGNGFFADYIHFTESKRMYVEIAILAVLIFGGLALLKRGRSRMYWLTAVVLVFSWIHVVFLPMVVSAMYLISLLAIGRFLRKRVFSGERSGSDLIFLFIWTSFLAPPLQSLCIASFLPLALEKSPGCA